MITSSGFYCSSNDPLANGPPDFHVLFEWLLHQLMDRLMEKKAGTFRSRSNGKQFLSSRYFNFSFEQFSILFFNRHRSLSLEQTTLPLPLPLPLSLKSIISISYVVTLLLFHSLSLILSSLCISTQSTFHFSLTLSLFLYLSISLCISLSFLIHQLVEQRFFHVSIIRSVIGALVDR